tara:strand:- start:1278 stop:2693 length:1416 start_codon:yes stop_codon:yes gene_type:complete
MQVRKRYQNGGGVPGGDPKRQAEQLAFAQLLQDEAFKKKLEEKMRLRDEYGVYADDPAGLPSTDPFLALTAAGDAEAIGSGVAEMAGGDLLSGAGNVLLGAASVAIPGTLPKIKNIRGIELTTRSPKTRGDLATLMVGDTEIARVTKLPPIEAGVDGKSMFEPYIGDKVADLVTEKKRIEALTAKKARTAAEDSELQSLRQKMSLQEPEVQKASASTIQRSMAMATREMLDAVPVGSKVGSASLSADSYGILLDKWRRGQLSARRFDEDMLNEPSLLNDYGRPYKNSPEVEAWHAKREDPTVKGYDETTGFPFDNTYAPRGQMDIDTFASVDPAAKAARQAGDENKLFQQYIQYSTQSNNKYGLGSLANSNSDARLTREEAQSLADVFNMSIRRGADGRGAQQTRLLKSKGDKAKVADDLGIPEARVVENSQQFPGYFTVAYPQIPFHRNFEYGGKFKIKKKRRPGMQVKR